MKLKIELTMDNAAFDPVADEIQRILTNIGEDISNGTALCEIGDHETLRDINGNTVGEARVTR